MNRQPGSGTPSQIPNYKAAVINFDAKLFQKEQNIAKLYDLARQAARQGCKLIVMPEMATTGYCWYSREEIAPYVEPVPGPSTDKFATLAKEYGCWIVVSLPEVDPATDIYYNTAVLVGPEGIVGVYRKTHHYVADAKWSRQGDLPLQVFETPIGNIGMLICMDVNIPETARILGLRGADVIANPTAWVGEKTPGPSWATRAFENGCYMLSANRVGLERGAELTGGSALFNPDGTIQAYADAGDCLAIGEVEIAKARAKDFAGRGHKFAGRRPREYMTLMQHTHLWNPMTYYGLYGHDPLPRGKRSKISVAQTCPVPGDLAANLAAVEQRATEAAAMGSELVVFPELALSGLVTDKEAAEAAALTIPGPALEPLIDCCMKHGLHLVVGLVERDAGALYNTAVLLGPDGMVGRYRKLHLGPRDEGWASPGDLGFRQFNTPVGRVGIMIGQDALLPESGRVLALLGADILCCPSAVDGPGVYPLGPSLVEHSYPKPFGHVTVHFHLWRVRAGENCSYLAFANVAGRDGGGCMGRSGIFGPDFHAFPRHEVILSAGREELGTLEIATGDLPGTPFPTNPARRKNFIPMRQPLWYDPIVADHPPVLSLPG